MILAQNEPRRAVAIGDSVQRIIETYSTGWVTQSEACGCWQRRRKAAKAKVGVSVRAEVLTSSGVYFTVHSWHVVRGMSMVRWVAFFAAVTALSFYIFVWLLPERQPPIDVPSLLGRLKSCRAVKGSDCDALAKQAIDQIVAGDRRFLIASARSQFDIYYYRDLLVYLRRSCRSADLDIDYFGLNVWPTAVNALPEARRQFGFASLDFTFKQIGFMVEGSCLVVADIPFRPISRIQTGQWIQGKGWAWEANMQIPPIMF